MHPTLRALPRLLVPAILLSILGVFLLWPIWLTIRGGFVGETGLTLRHVQVVLADPLMRAGLVNALLIAVGTTLLSILIGLPLAVLNARHDYPFKGTLAALILVPLILPPFVGAIGLHHILGRFGALNTLLLDLGLLAEPVDFIGRGGIWAIIAIQALHLYPIVYLNATAALANLDPALDEAAENLGAGPWRRFREITMPLIRPGLFAGSTIVFIWAFTELGTPLMFDFQVVTPVQILNGLKELDGGGGPTYALTGIMLAIALLCYVVGRKLFGGQSYAMYGKASVAARTTRLTGLAGLGATAAFAGVTVVAILPHLGVVAASFAEVGGWYRTVLPGEWTTEHWSGALSHPLATGSIRNSLFYASIAMMLDIVFGVVIAYVVVRTRVPGRRLIDALTMLPLAVPGLVMAFGYVAMTLRWPFNEGAPLEGVADVLGAEPNPVMLLIVAYAVRRLPYVVRSAIAGLEQTSVELEEAAMNMGATRVRAVRTVVLPLITANLIAGGLLAFSFAMLEVSDSLILAQRAEHFPITKAIYVLFERLGDGSAIASAMGVWGMLLLGLTLAAASAMIGKRMGAIFRV